jgi:hypothetical protein
MRRLRSHTPYLLPALILEFLQGPDIETDDVRCRTQLSVDPRCARRVCDGRIVLRFLRRKAAGPYRELVFSYAAGQKLPH